MSEVTDAIEKIKAEKNAAEAERLEELFEEAVSGELKASGGCCGASNFFDNSTNPNACEFGKPRKPWQHANYSCGAQAGSDLPGADYPVDVDNEPTVIKEKNMRP